MTLRNATNRALRYFISPHRKDMTIDLMRGQERLERKDLRPKPGASFEERMKYVTAGSAGQFELAPGKEEPFSMQLEAMYDLTPGDYIAQAKRKVPKVSGEDADVQISSGITRFKILPAAVPNPGAGPNSHH